MAWSGWTAERWRLVLLRQAIDVLLELLADVLDGATKLARRLLRLLRNLVDVVL